MERLSGFLPIDSKKPTARKGRGFKPDTYGRETHNLLEVVNYILDNRNHFMLACEKMTSVSNYDDGRLFALKL